MRRPSRRKADHDVHFIHITNSMTLVFQLRAYITGMGEPEKADVFFEEFNRDPSAVKTRLQAKITKYRRLQKTVAAALLVPLVFGGINLVRNESLPWDSPQMLIGVLVPTLLLIAAYACLFMCGATNKNILTAAFSPIERVVYSAKLRAFLDRHPAVEERFQECNLELGMLSGHAAFVSHIYDNEMVRLGSQR